MKQQRPFNPIMQRDWQTNDPVIRAAVTTRSTAERGDRSTKKGGI
jgi:hypothetical protein